jgi:hypothetical protein
VSLFFKSIKNGYERGKVHLIYPSFLGNKKNTVIKATGLLWLKEKFLTKTERNSIIIMAKNNKFLEQKKAFDHQYACEQIELEKEFSLSKYNNFLINIWDDYSETEPSSTYAYLCECKDDIPDSFVHSLFTWLQPIITKSLNDACIDVSLCFYQSLDRYPELLGTEYERLIYNRWQLVFSTLSHEQRELLTDTLNEMKLRFQNKAVGFISES